MKYIAVLFFLVVTIVSHGQSNAKPFFNKLNLEKNEISLIEISNFCGPMDSCQVNTYKLTNSMTEGLIEQLNTSDLVGPCEFANEYWLNIYFVDGSTQAYITNGVLFGEFKKNDGLPSYFTKIEANDLCYKIKDSNQLVYLWTKLSKNGGN